MLTTMSSAPNASMAELTRFLAPPQLAHVVVVRDGFAAAALDDVDDLVGRRLVGALAGVRAAEVVDDDLRALRRELERLAATDAPPRTGDDRDLAVEQPHRCYLRLVSYVVCASMPAVPDSRVRLVKRSRGTHMGSDLDRDEIVGMPTGKATITIERGPVTQFAASVTETSPVYRDRRRREGGRLRRHPGAADVLLLCRVVLGRVPRGSAGRCRPRSQPDDGSHRQADVQGRHRAPRRAGVRVPQAVVVGDRISSEGKVVDLYEKPTGDKTMTFLVTENQYRNQDGDLVLTARMNLIHRG